MPRVDAFAVDSKGHFLDHRKEDFAKACAKTGQVKLACEHSGVAMPTGVKWRGHASMANRIASLRAGAETFVGVSKAWIIDRYRQNAEDAASNEDWKASNDALAKIYTIITHDADMSAEKGAAGGAPAEYSAAQLKEERERLFPRALPSETRVMVEDDDGIFSEEDGYEEDRNPPSLDAELGADLPPLTQQYQEMAVPPEAEE